MHVDDAVGDPVEEVAVVGDEHHRAVEALDGRLEHLDGVDVEVVGRLVQHQAVRARAHEQQELEPRPLAAGEVVDLLAALLVGEEEAQAAFAQLLQAMKKSLEKSSDQGRLREVVEGLATLAGKLPAEKADQLLGAVVNLSKPVCSGLAPLVNVSLPEIVDALKWPTCASEESSVLIEKIGQAKGRAFGRKVDDRFVADEWSFADWAEREGFDLKSPSLRRPQFVQ